MSEKKSNLPAPSDGGSLAQMSGGNVPARGVVIAGLDDLARFANMVLRSGTAPKGLNVEGIAVAIQHGLELGLAPLQAVQSIAVINGRPSIYGDAAKALVEASDVCEDYDQWYECDGKKLVTPDGDARTPTATEIKRDDCTCFVKSKRVNRKPIITSYSVADAKTAKLWGKAGPWTEYPARMLMWRARGFNLRDNFGDVLKGLRTVEEVQDIPANVRPTAAERPALAANGNGNGGKADELAARLSERASPKAGNDAPPQRPEPEPEPLPPESDNDNHDDDAATDEQRTRLCRLADARWEHKAAEYLGLFIRQRFNSTLAQLTGTQVQALIDHLDRPSAARPASSKPPSAPPGKIFDDSPDPVRERM